MQFNAALWGVCYMVMIVSELLVQSWGGSLEATLLQGPRKHKGFSGDDELMPEARKAQWVEKLGL